MSKYTPGPWKVERLTHVGTNVFGLANEMTAREFVETNWDANARLIAAAPELLEALKSARESLGIAADNECGCESGSPAQPEFVCGWHQSLFRVEDAIAKAEGKDE